MKRVLIIWFIFLSILYLMTSCGSVKKVKDKELTKTKSVSEVKLQETERVKELETNNENYLGQILTNSDFLTIDISPGDSIVITNTDADGKTSKTVFSGSGTIKKGKESKKEDISKSTNIVKESNAERVKDSIGKTTTNTTTKKKTVDIERKGIPWWSWLLLVLAILFLVGRWLYRKYKKVNLLV